MAYKQLSPIPVDEGGTGAQTLTDHGVVLGSGTSAVTVTGVGTDGQVMLGATGADPAFATLTSTGSTIAFTPGANSLNLEAGSAVAIQFDGDSGSAVPSSGVITFTGSTTGLTFTGSGSTQTLGGTLAIANGGTNATSMATSNGALFYDGTSVATVPSGAATMNTGTNSLSISSDASATTVNVGTGAAAKAVTIGSTNTTSSLALQYGTADMTMASATGTVISALDTGEVTMPLQPAFLGVQQSQASNVTGAGTDYTLGSSVAFTERFDQNADFNTNGTFTAPVTGRYVFYFYVAYTAPSGATGGTGVFGIINTSNKAYRVSPLPTRNACTGFAGPSNFIPVDGSMVVDMDASDTCTIIINGSGGSGNNDDIYGDSSNAWTAFGGYLVC